MGFDSETPNITINVGFPDTEGKLFATYTATGSKTALEGRAEPPIRSSGPLVRTVLM